MACLTSCCAPAPELRADEEAKWLTWHEYLDLCEELRSECAALDSIGRRRSDAAVAWSLQKYLIFAILSCVPDRQVRPAASGPRGCGCEACSFSCRCC